MTQSKRKKHERVELVNIFPTVLTGYFVKCWEKLSRVSLKRSSLPDWEQSLYHRVEGEANYRNGHRDRKEPLSTGLGL